MHTVLAELAVTRFTWVTNLRAAMELRAAFALQVVGMALNDFAFVAVWLMFFDAVGTVNGWNGMDAIAMLGFGVLAFGLAFGFAGGSLWIPRFVEQGTLDSFILSPRNLYIRVAASRFDLPALGDGIFGLLLVGIYVVHLGSVLPLLWFATLLPPAVMILISVSMTCGLAAFYFPDANSIVQSFFKLFLTPSIYPSTLFPPWAKTVFTFVIPSLAVGGLPVEAVKGADFGIAAVVWGVGIAWLLISIVAFYAAVRRYESGNALGMRG